MNEREEIERLERELNEKKKALQDKIRNCDHEWTDVKYDPEHYKKSIFSHYEPHGSDPEPIYEYVPATKDRWSRTCKKCGKIEYGYKKGVVKEEIQF